MYKTNSLTLASYLRTITELDFKGVDRSNTDKIEFMFANEELAEKCADDFFAGKDGAIKLFENYHTLKDMIFEIKRNNQSKRT